MSTTDNLTITRILTEVAARQASDVHFSVGSQPIIRHDGKLEPLAEELAVTPEFMQELVGFFIDEAGQTTLAQQKNLTLSYALDNRARFRVHLSYQKGYPAVDLRLISVQIPEAATLGLPKRIIDLTDEREGLIVISGPAGSGRTTTLISLLDYINHQSARHIVTFEDPVEYLINNDRSFVQQKSLGADVPNISAGLENLRSEDVDVLGISVPLAMADWQQVLTLARAGTLVLVIIEADSAVRALESMVASWPGETAEGLKIMLGETFLGSVSQRLVARLGGGRVLVTECLLGIPPVRSLIKEGKVVQLQNVLQLSRGEGMVSLEQSLAQLVNNGEILPEEAKKQAVSQEALASILRVKE